MRGVRREAGGAPRSTQGGGSAAAAASQGAETRTPGAHVRVSFTRPTHPIAYGYGAHTWVFRQNFALYSVPRRWLRMAYCTVCLDGPVDRSGIVLDWGDSEGAPFVVSGQAWGEENLIGRAAIPEYQVRWRWQKDSVAIWDNRSTQHYAVMDYWPAVRKIERAGIVGDVPF